MSEYLHVERPFLGQLAVLGWSVVDQGQGMVPSDPAKSLRAGIDTEILLAGVPALEARHERIAVEIVKLAEKRQEELLE